MSSPRRWYVITPRGELNPSQSFTVQGAVQLFRDRKTAELMTDLLVTRDRREDYEVVRLSC